MFRLSATICIALGAAAPVFAADVSYHAETVSTAKRQGAINAGNVAWQCDGVKCVGIGPWATPPPSLCVALAREVGPFRVFAQFAPRDVAACNDSASGSGPAAPKAAPPAKAPPKAAPGSGQA
ncbi:MAG TPA: hypothetical protein VII68_00535 [Casimicrobiaceae bacterium]|jgi:hypothetical protein